LERGERKGKGRAKKNGETKWENEMGNRKAKG